ncbi:uncharacterized protein LOC116250269 isoform X2 [Nymphaea colorata]|uniref:uncharacterized protein LOC116250269 isoform X2 n=1 Tax=Nymphaea colorata TaxID=210225 RepID=UPI00129D257C|nr:uncharacterized protein LOC116250269 isoform X2 [Nymphaea colorata]
MGMTMRNVHYLRVVLFLCLYLYLFAPATSQNLTIDAAHPTALYLSSGQLVEGSPISKPRITMVCQRIHVQGVPRLLNLKKYSNTFRVKVKILETSSDVHLRKVVICFHRNISIEVGMYPPGEWEKLSKDTWIGSMSPYDYRLLDICMPPPFLSLEVSTEEETKLFRLIFLVLGALLIILSPEMSKSAMFYYSNAMILGIVLVILIVLFQGMKLLPTGRKRSLMIFLYGSIVGLGTVILRYLSGLLHSVLSDIGLNEDIYNPVALFLLVCLVLAGAWLGFWGVRKLVLSEDGAVDASVSLFVRWAIRIFGAVMITQSSLDPLLATGALVFAASFLPASRTAFGDGIFYHWLMYLVEAVKCIPQTFSARDYLYEGTSTDFFDEVSGRETKMFKPRTKAYKWVPCTIFGRSAVTPEKSNFRPDKGTYFSTFHRTPDRKRFSKEEWDAFTKDETRKALKELVSSPEFGQWAVNNAERITLSPANHNDRGDTTRRGGRWFKWF